MPLLQTPFRLFFLLAGIQAALWIPLWIALFEGALPVPSTLGLLAWHRHEMLFGYTTAVLAGFLLTAGRSWTGRPTVTGAPLAGLAALWLAARLALLLPTGLPPGGTALLDVLFLPAVALALARPVLAARSWRNLGFVPLLLFMAAGNAAMHADALGLTEGVSLAGARVGLLGMVTFLVIVGGRVVPYFTRRALGSDRPAETHLQAVLTNGPALLALGLDGLRAPDPWAGAAYTLALLALGVRWLRWQRAKVWTNPLLAVLHMGYAWVLAGFAMKALAGLHPAVPDTLAVHFWTAGGLGTLSIGMMARVSLGHTGRPLRAPPLYVASFVLVQVAAAVRALGPILLPELYIEGLRLAAGLWSLAFVAFLVEGAPIFLRPRADGKPG